MKKEDFFTGEEIQDSSPPISVFTSEQQAINNASFGSYDYDPAARAMNQQFYNPAGYNYNNYQQPQPGIGIGNPAYQFIQQQQYQQQQYQMQSDVQVYVPPVNLFGSEYLPPANFVDELDKLKFEFWNKEQEHIGTQTVSNPYSYNNYGINYYGVPYSNYNQNNINIEASKLIQKMQDEAKESRTKLNINLSKLARNICKIDYDEQSIDEMYRGKFYERPLTYNELYTQQRFENCIPFDNSAAYREFNESVSNEYHKVIPKNANLKECFDNTALLSIEYEMENEQHRRRNGKNLYNTDDNAYKLFIRQKAAERYAKKNGLPISKQISNFDSSSMKQDVLNTFPTLSQTAKLTDDGTLNITCNFGSKAGQVYSVNNLNESQYNQDSENFKKFIETIPNSIYLDSPNPTT